MESQVKDSRPSEAGRDPPPPAVPRVRRPLHTFERVQLRELTIVNVRPALAVDREKLVRSISLAMQKRPVDPERVDRMVKRIVRQLESLGETELPSSAVGEMA